MTSNNVERKKKKNKTELLIIEMSKGTEQTTYRIDKKEVLVSTSSTLKFKITMY